MKSAKIMLTAIAVLAVVGGTLAFKANKKFLFTYCLLTTVGKPNGGLCTTEKINYKVTVVAAPSYWYTTKNVGLECTQQQCNVTSTLVTAE